MVKSESDAYVLFDNYRIEYTKYETDELKYYTKKVYKDELIYSGYATDTEMKVTINQLDKYDMTKLNFNKMFNYNFITKFGFDFQSLNKKEDLLNPLKHIKNEIIKTTDNKHPVEFTYTYGNTFGNTFGNKFGTPQNIIVTQNETDEKINSIDQHNFDSGGQHKNHKSIDETNQLVVTALSQEEINAGRIGYKAARTADNKMCIIKLFLPPDARVAWDSDKDKYRTDKVIPLTIKKAYYGKTQHFYTRDLDIEDCPVCADAMATHIAYPCRHKLCGDCWKEIITEGNNNCPYCRAAIEKVDELPLNRLPENTDTDEEITEAYSCIYTDKFVYRKNEQVIIGDFDGDLNKVCAAGIHFHDKEADVFQWFEYLDIPEPDVLSDDIPWTENSSKNDIIITNK